MGLLSQGAKAVSGAVCSVCGKKIFPMYLDRAEELGLSKFFHASTFQILVIRSPYDTQIDLGMIFHKPEEVLNWGLDFRLV